MKEITSKFLNKLKCENMRYYTIEDGKGIAPDIVTVAYFAERIYDMRICFLFRDSVVEARVLGLGDAPLYKRDALIDGVNALYVEHKWLAFDIDRNSIIAKVDTRFGIDEAIDICYDIINKISRVMWNSKIGHIW